MNTVSIAMATYNGIKYIGEQLDSLRAQTLPPDEVIIADDKSTDGTYEFCRDYIERYDLTGWRVYQNEHNIGVRKNFRDVMAKCTGEYIFTCDQDDIWMPEKIRVMLSVIRERPEIRLLASNYVAIMDGKTVRVPVKNVSRNDGEVIPFKLQESGLMPMRPGCTYCFRRELLNKFNVMDIDTAIHDAMLWGYAASSDSLYLLNRQLIFWRRHDNTVTGTAFSHYPGIEQRIQDTYENEKIYHKFLDAAEGLEMPAQNVKFMNEIINCQGRRRDMLAKRSVLRAALFVMKNMKYYPTLRNALSDIYAMIFLKQNEATTNNHEK